ncbi:MAG TPA: hypothetical protein VHP13_00525 [Gammaproteobacteria bacterium]|nr:hypothetical protein [Gammaproteobacteria bacterium]
MLAILAFLSGCATPPKDAPAFSVAALPDDPAFAELVVYRQMVPPLAYKSTVSVNGVEAVEMPNDGFAVIPVKPGHISVKNDWSFAAGNPAGAVDIEVEAGHRYYFEVTYVGGGNPVSLAVNMASFHTGVQGRGFDFEEEAQALPVLTKCCRAVALDEDYVPPDPAPSDIPTTDVDP